MRNIAIIGAGELGGAIAHVLARRDAAAALRLVDERGRVAEGKALDIAQAGPVEGFTTTVSGSTDLTRAAGAEVVILADAAGGPEWQGDEGLRMVQRTSEIAPSAVVLCAGASQRDVVDRAVRELGLDRRRIVGTGPEALAAGARALVALALNGSPRDVALSILGVPPAQAIVPWEDASVAGYALMRLIDEPTRRQLGARINALWPPGPHALAAVAAKAVDVIAGRTRSVLSCFVAPDDSLGVKARTVALPVRLGPGGIQAVVLPELSVIDRVALDNAMLL